MTQNQLSITMSEWETLGPETCHSLKGRFLDSSQELNKVRSQLESGKFLSIVELRQGLEIRAYSHVGRVQVGNISITIRPKIKGPSLLRLFRYAYGFRNIDLISVLPQHTDQCGIDDILISQLNSEAKELLARGVVRSYVENTDQLSSPRGRIDFRKMASAGAAPSATLPCTFYHRTSDTLLNQVLLAGLKLAAGMTNAVNLKRDSYGLADRLADQTSAIRLDQKTVQTALRKVNRLTSAYASAIKIIEMLLNSNGVLLEDHSETVPLPGFLFNMNAFFQALISRFLHENLPGYTVADEFGLKGMMRYSPQHNPRHRHSPAPRPDYVIRRNGATCALLDAKYRDLWEHQLPRDMLYQLVIYAISQRAKPQSVILYPTMNLRAKEARIDVSDPVYGKPLGQVCLKPVLIPKLEEMITSVSRNAKMERVSYATELAFGSILAMHCKIM